VADWGDTAINATGTTMNWARAMGGTFAGGDNQVLTSISVALQGSGSGDTRVAVYQGGSLSTGPDAADLIWDGGIITDSGSDAYVTTTHPGPFPALTNDAVTWISLKGNDGTVGVFYNTDNVGTDFQAALGRFATGGEIDSTEGVAWPDPWPTDSGSFGAFWYSLYFSYQSGSSTLPGYHGTNRGIFRGINRGVG